jgi:hypothetical protein
MVMHVSSPAQYRERIASGGCRNEGDGLCMKDVPEQLPDVLTPNESESIVSNE